jgi:DNA-binding MarR family transcriptional regulator
MSTDMKLQGCTNFKVRQLARRLTEHYDAEVAKCGLKTTQYSLLSHIASLGPIRPVDLAAEMQMTASTLSRNLQPLIAAGWVLLAPGADARSRLVQATQAGLAKRREAQHRWKAAQQALNARLSPERVAELHALIDGALATLATAGSEAQHARTAPADAA